MSARITPPKQPAPPPRSELTAEEIVARLDAYEKPPGHPQDTVFRAGPDSRHIRELTMIFEASGVLPYLERKLRASGPDSRLTVLALLIALFYVAGELGSYWRTNAAKFLASLDPRDAVALGVQPLDTLLKPISYTVVCKQAQRLERALRDGWVDESDGKECDLRWFCKAIIWASVPPRIARQITTVAMDATDIPSCDRPRESGTDGAPNLDPDATYGHRSANSERQAGTYRGFALTVCVATRPWRITRSRTEVAFGPPVLGYVVSMMLDTAAAGVAQIGADAVDDANELCPNIDVVVTDRGYSQLGPTFNRYMHTKNRDLVMDYKDSMLRSAKPVRLGPSRYPAFFHAGTFLHAYTPPNKRVPEPGLNEKELQEFYSEREERFGLRVHASFHGGGKQFSSPVRDRRLNIDPDKRTGVGEDPLYFPPEDLEEIFGAVPDDIYRQEFISAPVEDLDYHQSTPWGTPLHKQVYGKRNPSENCFSEAKEEYALAKKRNRVKGIAARHIMCLARIVWYNLKRTREYKKQLKAEKRARRAAKKTRPKTHPTDRHNESAASQTAGDHPDSPTHPPPPT